MPNPTVIRHESVSTYIDVTADAKGRDVATVARDVHAVLEQVEASLEHHAEVMGGLRSGRLTRPGLVGVAITAAIAVFLLLQAAFRSWRLAALSFSTLPLAIAGGVVAALPTGGTLTLGSIAGLVAVVGFVARAVIPLDPPVPEARA